MAKKKKGKKKGGLQRPPFLSFDPALEAERRASERGLSDVKQDIKIQRKQGKQDFRTSLKDIGVKGQRGREDFATNLRRGLIDINQDRSDVRTTLARGGEDFRTALTGLIRNYQQRAQAQTQQANAAGVIGGGTEIASQRRRASNFQFERQPLDIALRRTRSDAARDIGRLGTQERELRTDVGQGLGRLGEDVTHDTRLARRDWRRERKGLKIKGQRAIREQRIGDIDLTQQQIFQARQLKPGAFSRTGRKTKKGKKKGGGF